MKLLILLLISTPAFAFVEDGGFHPEPCPTQINNQLVQSVSIISNDSIPEKGHYDSNNSHYKWEIRQHWLDGALQREEG